MIIELKDYTKIIKGVPVLNCVNLRFESGNIYGITGTNGSGKTMLLRAISGLLLPSSGAAYIDGKELGKQIEFPDNMGIFIERPNFLSYLTGFENLKYLAEIQGKTPDERIKEYMKLFFLDPNDKKPYKKYSQGMKQKIGIIQAIMENQQLIILDEPFNALDKESVRVLKEWLIEAKSNNKLVILTSHSQVDISTLCNSVFFVDSGKVEKEL